MIVLDYKSENEFSELQKNNIQNKIKGQITKADTCKT